MFHTSSYPNYNTKLTKLSICHRVNNTASPPTSTTTTSLTDTFADKVVAISTRLLFLLHVAYQLHIIFLTHGSPSHLEKQRKHRESHVLWLVRCFQRYHPARPSYGQAPGDATAPQAPQSGSWTTSLASHSASEWMITLLRWLQAKPEHLRGLYWCNTTSHSTPWTASDLLPSERALDHRRMYQQRWLDGGQKTDRDRHYTVPEQPSEA